MNCIRCGRLLSTGELDVCKTCSAKQLDFLRSFAEELRIFAEHGLSRSDVTALESMYLAQGILPAEIEYAKTSFLDRVGVELAVQKTQDRMETIMRFSQSLGLTKEAPPPVLPESKPVLSTPPTQLIRQTPPKSRGLLLQNSSFDPVDCYQERVLKRGHRGYHTGVSIRIVKGLWWRIGTNIGATDPEYGPSLLGTGTFVVSPVEVAFLSEGAAFAIGYKKLLNLVVYDDGVSITRDSSARNNRPYLFTYSGGGQVLAEAIRRHRQQWLEWNAR